MEASDERESKMDGGDDADWKSGVVVGTVGFLGSKMAWLVGQWKVGGLSVAAHLRLLLPAVPSVWCACLHVNSVT